MKKYIYIIAINVAVFLPTLAFSQVYINEVLASNKGIISDELFDKSSDWVELYNAATTNVNLSDYYLTDDRNDKKKWRFPKNTIIDGKSYLLVWADGKNIRLHTNFKLKAENDYIALYENNLLVDSASLINQQANISYGKFNHNWVYFSEPTPESYNNRGSMIEELPAEKQKTPDNKKIGRKIFNSDIVHEIRINFPFSNPIDSLFYYKDSVSDNNYLQANVEVDGKTLFASGIRIKGESSYEFYPGDKKSFKIKFNKFIKGQKLNGLTHINLNNGFKDPSMLREKIYFDFMNKQGLPAPRSTYAYVYINNEEYGLYLLTEEISKQFFEYNFNNKNGHLYKGEPNAKYQDLGNTPELYRHDYISYISKNKNIIDYDLLELIKIINCTSCSDVIEKEMLDGAINTNNLLKIFAITSIFLNIDAYNLVFSHNHYLYKNEESNKFEWIPYDGNYAFCAWSPAFTYNDATNLDIFFIQDEEKRPLLNVLYSNPYYKSYYEKYMKDVLENQLTDFYIEKQVDSLALKIRKYVYQDPKKMYTNEEFEENLKTTIGDKRDPGAFIPGIMEFHKDRRNSILQQLDK